MTSKSQNSYEGSAVDMVASLFLDWVRRCLEHMQVPTSRNHKARRETTNHRHAGHVTVFKVL